VSDQIPVSVFRAALLALLDETFTEVTGIYLDRGTSMFETLATVSAEDASRPVGGGCASLAAQVNHTTFYLDVAQQFAAGNPPQKVDWDASWDVCAVDDEEWQVLIQKLRDAYQATRHFAATFGNWNEDFVGGALGIVAHCAYHLGEIRQALCTLKGNRTKAA
jgi:hypothetical protein